MEYKVASKINKKNKSKGSLATRSENESVIDSIYTACEIELVINTVYTDSGSGLVINLDNTYKLLCNPSNSILRITHLNKILIILIRIDKFKKFTIKTLLRSSSPLVRYVCTYLYCSWFSFSALSIMVLLSERKVPS